MAFTHGKNARVYAGTYVLTPYLRQIGAAGQADVAEASVFGTDDKQYVVGLADATLSGEGYLDTTDVGAGKMLDTGIGTALKSTWSVYPAGDALGNTGQGMLADTTSFEPGADLGDVVGFSFEAQSSVGLERLVSHIAHGTRSTAGTTTAIDNTAATGFGGAGYLHVTALSGSMAVRIEHSADNNTYTTLVNFGTVTGPVGTRVAFSGTANRYTRLVHTPATTGTAAFVAGLARKTR
jgi:hypothetical protein